MSAPRPKTVAFVSAVFPYPADNGKKVVISGFLRFLIEAVGAENLTYVALGTFDRSVSVPFRIVTTDGTTYDVRHPELVMVAMGSAVVGYPDATEPAVAARYDTVSMRHIIRLEPMPQVSQP